MSVAALSETQNEQPFIQPGDKSEAMLRLLTCGSVDDGKSTLIGRLLWDAAGVTDDQRAQIMHASHARAVNGERIDFSLLLDGLVAEREQGITIDIAWRYFETERRRFVIIDSPGHEQYTRNMATGASHADVAILLVDARHGVKRQTRRNAAISGNFSFTDIMSIPVAALTGANVVARSEEMPWYDGPTLLEYLESVEARSEPEEVPFRMPVQMVLRAANDFRGYAGTVTSGSIRVGDRVVDARSGLGATLRRISTMDGDLETASSGDAVTLVLDTDLDISRGAVLTETERRPTNADVLEARLVWLSEKPFDPEAGYLLRTATDLTPVTSVSVSTLIDFETLSTKQAHDCSMNDIADCRILLGRSTAVDLFGDLPLTGNFVLVNALDGATVAGGVITWVQTGAAAVGDNVLVLDRARLSGLCADLGDSPEDRAEFDRRAQEVAILLRSAGVPVQIETDR
ncbi:MAG: GTP-binding protein [Methyloceanibacter sp.]